MNKREILIIEDEPRSRRNIKEALKNEDYNFIEAASLKEAVAKADDNPTARVVLLDLSLPDGTGVKFLEHIYPTASKYRVIILSAHDEKLAAEKARDFAVFNYLPKASKSFTESLRFSVEHAFTDIDRDNLRNKNKSLIDIQKKINTEILESSSVTETLRSLDKILTIICKTVTDPYFIGAYTCHIRLYSLSKGELYLASFAGSDDSVKAIFNDPDGWFSGKVAKLKRPKIFTDLQNNKDFNAFRDDKLNEIRDSSLRKQVERYFQTVKSAYITPITTQMFDNETDAVFNVSSDSEDFFSEERQEVVREFVTLATTAITKAWQKKRKVESHQDYKGISDVLERVSKELSGKDVKDKIYDEFLKGVSKIINPETISVFLYDERTGLLDNKAEFKGDKRVPPRMEGHPLDLGLTGKVFRKQELIRVPNLQKGDRTTYEQHPDYNEDLATKYIGEIPSRRIEHYLGVPMIFGEHVIGVVQLINKKSAYYENSNVVRKRWLLERGFSNDCEYVLGIAASHLAVAIKNAELFEERARQIEQLEILKDVGRYTSTEMLEQLLKKINDQAAKAVKAEICLMFLLDETERKVVLEQSYGIPIEALTMSGRPAEYKIGEGFTGEVAKTGISRLEKAGKPTGKYDQLALQYLNKDGQGHTLESLMIVPIKVKEKIFGVIKAINKKDGGEQYNDIDLKFFVSVASYVGIAIENGQSFEHATKRLTAAESKSTLSNLISAVVHEFGNTYGHIPDDVDELRDTIADISEDQSKLLDEITDLTMEMLFFTTEISGYSLGKKAVLEIIDINELINETINKFRDRSDDKDSDFRKTRNYDEVPLKFSPSKKQLLVEIHRFPIISTIRNIIINAYQALEGKAGGKITIETYENKDTRTVITKVTDNGTGIKEEFRGRIFEPEFTTKTGKAGKGSGLGLWLARTHVDSLGGKIDFKTEVGKGTEFFVELPLYRESHD